jgi:choline dehydrogenase
VLPRFKKIESWHGPPHELRGTNGPLHVALPADPHPLAQAFVAAGPDAGLPILEDHNGPTMEGASFVNLTVKDGRRFSVVDGYLRPILNRPNLTVRMQADVHQLLIEKGRCVGVSFDSEAVRATREVILCAGALGSPRLLLLSGIGPAADLAALGIPTVHDLPGVGRNYQDHMLCGMVLYEGKSPLPPARNNGVESTFWWKSDSRSPAPDIQGVIVEFPFATPELASRIPGPNCYGIAPCLVLPSSRGSVSLFSADPKTPLRIDPNFLAEEADLAAMHSAVELSRAVGASSAFAEYRGREVMPGPLDCSAMTEFIRNAASTYFHPVGTCRMGTGPDCVVDHRLRVRGVDGLRIADASIMPSITCANTNAPSVMIGETAAEMIGA